MIKSRYLNKFYIKQLVLSSDEGLSNIEKEWPDIIKDSVVIGYLYLETEPKFGQRSIILNLYLIKSSYYNGDIITLKKLKDDWDIFVNISKVYPKISDHVLFVNPPIKEWLDTKDNWCKKIASEMANKFSVKYDEALSNVYLSIMKCYNKKTVYMGNLNYIRKAIFNDFLVDIRDNKNKLNQDSGLAISMNLSIGTDKDGNELTLEDTLSDTSDNQIDYNELYDCVVKLLSNTFSQREIDQIINNNKLLPDYTYRKLLRWRKEHSPIEIYEQTK